MNRPFMATKNIQQATILHWPNENLKIHILQNVKTNYRWLWNGLNSRRWIYYLKWIKGASTNYFTTLIRCQRNKLSRSGSSECPKISVTEHVPSSNSPIQRCTQKTIITSQKMECSYSIGVLRECDKTKPWWNSPYLPQQLTSLLKKYRELQTGKS